jgi:hypothetical protein
VAVDPLLGRSRELGLRTQRRNTGPYEEARNTRRTAITKAGSPGAGFFDLPLMRVLNLPIG